MPRISVVVPIYNVERYLVPCLDSIARQTYEDFEVVMVDDGSTDASAGIAEEFADRDRRFRLTQQPNGGLGNARNNGMAEASGEFLAFVDSDDVLPPDAYERLITALDETGSDFATGNVHRLSATGTRQSPFLARTFAETRLKTHVLKFHPLLADRIVPNKLWRRTFWDAHDYRFPEGVLHEDIPVVLPAQFAAKSVDVIAEPVYYYRIREGGDLSITQRRAEQKALLDRLDAVNSVIVHLEEEGPRKARDLYASSVVRDDLRYYLNALDAADEDYRGLFLDRVNTFLDHAPDDVFDHMWSIDRLKWHLVRRRLMPELLEVLEFQRSLLSDTPPVRENGHWYGDYPFRGDKRLNIPDDIYRLDREFGVSAHLNALRFDEGGLQVEGAVYIQGIGAPEQGSQKVELRAIRPGPLRRVRLRLPAFAPTAGVAFETREVHRPEMTMRANQRLVNLDWSGFEATLDPKRLKTAGRWRSGKWELYFTVAAGGVKRRRARFSSPDTRPVGTVELPVDADAAVRAAPQLTGEVALEVDTAWAALTGTTPVEGGVEVHGELRIPATDDLKLELRRADAAGRRRYDVAREGNRFTSTVKFGHVAKDIAPPTTDPRDYELDGTTWELWLTGAGGLRRRVRIPVATERPVWAHGAYEIGLQRNGQGDASIVARTARASLTGARWTEEGELVVEGELRADGQRHELVVLGRNNLERHVVPLDTDGDRFSAHFNPGRIESLAGVLPLQEGSWDLFTHHVGDEDETHLQPVMTSQPLDAVVPLETTIARKPFTLAATVRERVVLIVQRDLAADERGQYHRLRLRRDVYEAGRGNALRDAVVFYSFGGRQYSDSPRAIHEELVRRGTDLEQLWVVKDARCIVPDTATVLRDGSREHYEALATARYVVSNDHFPTWFERRDDQICLQTWHGTPLKRLGLDVSAMHKTVRRFQRRWDAHVKNWQYVVSPNPFTTPILERAYGIEGELLETGYPRTDVLAAPGAEDRAQAVRRRLGIPDGVRTVLYAPTYRDGVVDRRGRYRLDQQLDVEALRSALGGDTVILYRKHHYVAGAAPVTDDGFVRDVTSYPDGTELMLAADVLVTDYSSMMFDFAVTGRPMLFFTYDLEAYRDQIRGFYFDFAEQSPGPLLETSAQLAGALSDLDAVRAQYADRYAAFRETFCPLDDGHATERVVDRVFGREL